MYTFSKPDRCKLSDLIKDFLMVKILRTNYLNAESIVDIDLSHPIIFLLGGVGGSGKSTFVDMCKSKLEGVYELSTIDCCKDVVKHMVDIEKVLDTSDLPDIHLSLLSKHVEEKSDAYRTLLHEIKSAWVEIDDGPNKLVVNQVKDLIKKDKSVSLIFINVREPDQIQHLKKLLEYTLSCLVFTLLVTRPTVQSVFSNEGDRKTLDYPYDINVVNGKDLDHLKDIATEFCDAMLSIRELS